MSLLLHMDGTNGSQTFTDSSTNNLTVTPNGNVQISTSVKKYGSGSASFDGSGDSITVPNSVVLGTGNFTVECWIYPNSTTGETTIFNQGNTDSTGNFIVFIANGLLRFWANSGLRYTGNNTIPINQWTHIAVTRDSNVYYFFINGVLDGTHSGTYNHSGTPFKIGDGYGGIRYFNGYIDDFRITKGVARYTSNFEPPTTAFPNP